MSDPARLRALAWIARWYEQQHPGARTRHLSEWADEEAARLEEIRRGLEWWPGQDSSASAND